MHLSLSEMTIEHLHQALTNKAITVVELVKYYLERIETIDSKINAIISINPKADRKGVV